jgi:hypothetical protein
VRENDCCASREEFADFWRAMLLALCTARRCGRRGERRIVRRAGAPRHHRASEAARLRTTRIVQAPSASDRGALSHVERRALSYGALYHPWIASGVRTSSRASAGAMRVVPPDGFAAGVLALRASARGAWIAPANETFKDAVALRRIRTPSGSRCRDAQINIVRQDARGFLALGRYPGARRTMSICARSTCAAFDPFAALALRRGNQCVRAQ